MKTLRAGFTLTELLIVVIILAIVASIIVPQFSSSMTDTQEATLDANLMVLRSAIELFKLQHNNRYPGATPTKGGPCTETSGSGEMHSAQAWMDHLLMASDAAGNTCSVGDATTFRYGPYLRKGIPPDPITGKGSLPAEIAVTRSGAPIVPAAAASGGWAVDTRSGQIVMNSNAKDSKGKAYSAH